MSVQPNSLTWLSAGADLQKQVLQEKSRAVTLEVQVRALYLELARARQAAGMLAFMIALALVSGAQEERPVCWPSSLQWHGIVSQQCQIDSA